MKKLFVRNLSYDVTSEQLKDLFEGCGTVASANVINDRYTGKSRGFGFVEMQNDDEAQKAIDDLNGQDIEGRAIVVDFARDDKRR